MKSLPKGELPSCDKCPLKDKEHMTTDEKALTMFNMCIQCSSFKTNRKHEPRFTKKDLDEVEHYVSLNVSTVRLGPNVTAAPEAITVNTDQEPGRFTATILPCRDRATLDIEIVDNEPAPPPSEPSFDYGLPLHIRVRRGTNAKKGERTLAGTVEYARSMLNAYHGISNAFPEAVDAIMELKWNCYELSRLSMESKVEFPSVKRISAAIDSVMYLNARKPV